MGVLAGDGQGNRLVAGMELSQGHPVFESVRDQALVEKAMLDNHVGGFESVSHIIAKFDFGADIVGNFVVKQGRAILDGLFHVNHDR